MCKQPQMWLLVCALAWSLCRDILYTVYIHLCTTTHQHMYTIFTTASKITWTQETSHIKRQFTTRFADHSIHAWYLMKSLDTEAHQKLNVGQLLRDACNPLERISYHSGSLPPPHPTSSVHAHSRPLTSQVDLPPSSIKVCLFTFHSSVIKGWSLWPLIWKSSGTCPVNLRSSDPCRFGSLRAGWLPMYCLNIHYYQSIQQPHQTKWPFERGEWSTWQNHPVIRTLYRQAVLLTPVIQLYYIPVPSLV